MIDAHAHFLPNIDDGAKSVAESLAMLREAYKQGVRLCVATPHAVIHDNDEINRFINNRKIAYQKLQSQMPSNSIDIPKILLGAEVYLDNDINQYRDIVKLCIENSNAMLIEFPLTHKFNHKAEEWIYELCCKKINPIIAHIERYAFRNEMLEALIDIPTVYQINSSVFKTIHGRAFLKKALKTNKQVIVSSDMHNMKKRKCNLQASYTKASKLFEQAENLFEINAKKILNIQ